MEAFTKLDNINFVSVIEAINDLPLDYTYSLSGLVEYVAKDSLFSLNENDRRCGKEAKDNCETKKYIDALVNKCKCLPFKLRFLIGKV